MKRWLAKQGATFKPGRGSHMHVYFNGKHTMLANHPSKELPTGTVQGIKKDLGLK